MPEARRYTGHADEIIEYATDVWLQWSGVDAPILLTDVYFQPAVPNECDTCGGSPICGVIPLMNSPHGIERCDECELFDGDFSAAEALAQLIEKMGSDLPKVEVWYYPND